MINNFIHGSGEKITSANLNKINADANNSTDDIHSQYREKTQLVTTVANGWVRGFQSFAGGVKVKAWIPFEHIVNPATYLLDIFIEDDHTDDWRIDIDLFNTSFASESLVFISAIIPGGNSTTALSSGNKVITKTPGTFLFKIETVPEDSGDDFSIGYNLKRVFI